jgi:hypothetical protein
MSTIPTAAPAGELELLDSANNNKNDGSSDEHDATHIDEADEEMSGDDLAKDSAAPAKLKRTKPFIVLVAAVAAFGGLIFGYDIGCVCVCVSDLPGLLLLFWCVLLAVC